jgi:elongation factor G
VAEPRRLIEVAIEPKAGTDRERMEGALVVLAREDSSLECVVDRESGRAMIKGTSERQIEAAIDRLKREFEIEAEVGALQIAYRETITKIAEIDYTHKKQTGGSGQFARIKLRFEPAKPGEGYGFASAIVGGAMPAAYIAGVANGLDVARETGVLAGFPVIDFKAFLTDGAYHDIDSSVLAFEFAARAAFREGIVKAAPRLLEPIMSVEVTTPDDVVGPVAVDLSQRGGHISAMETRGSACDITATLPLSRLLGYATDLAALTGGRGSWSMAFMHYASVGGLDPDPRFPSAAAARVA